MRYMVILIVTFAVYFWAVHNIGDRYVKKDNVSLPPRQSSDVTRFAQKYPVEDLQKSTSEHPVPTRRIVEY